MAPARRPLIVPLVAIIAIGVAYLIGTTLVNRASHVPRQVQGAQGMQGMQATGSPHYYAPKEAAVPAGAKPDRLFRLTVPALAPADILSARDETIKQGDVVEIVVTSQRPGAVIVHGLTDEKPVGADGQVIIKFRAIYSGRFPLHFHGDDGVHLDLMSLNVMPTSTDSR